MEAGAAERAAHDGRPPGRRRRAVRQRGRRSRWRGRRRPLRRQVPEGERHLGLAGRDRHVGHGASSNVGVQTFTGRAGARLTTFIVQFSRAFLAVLNLVAMLHQADIYGAPTAKTSDAFSFRPRGRHAGHGARCGTAITRCGRAHARSYGGQSRGYIWTLRHPHLIQPYLAYYEHLASQHGGPWCSPIPWWCD